MMLLWLDLQIFKRMIKLLTFNSEQDTRSLNWSVCQESGVRTHPSPGAALCLAVPGLCQREKLVTIVWTGDGLGQCKVSHECAVYLACPHHHTPHCLLLVTCTFNVQLNWTESVCYVHKRFRQFLAIDMSNNFISRSKTFINRSYNRITDKINIFYDQF